MPSAKKDKGCKHACVIPFQQRLKVTQSGKSTVKLEAYRRNTISGNSSQVHSSFSHIYFPNIGENHFLVDAEVSLMLLRARRLTGEVFR